VDHPVDGTEQELSSLCVPLDRAGGEPLQVKRGVVRSDHRAMRAPRY
jgi:hypothetical protein